MVTCRSFTALDGPGDDEPREQIQDRREVELAAAAAPDDELGRIADPRDQAGTYVNLITSSPMRSLATRRSRGRGPVKNGWP